MDNRIYGYARVSSREQNEDRQLEALTKFGIPEQNIIIDKCSGKDTKREGYQYLKRQILRKGDLCCQYLRRSLNWNVNKRYSGSARVSLLRNRRENTKADSLLL